MAWDPSRPVPWRRLTREWLLYAALIAVVFVAFLGDRLSVGTFVGLAASLPLYLALGFVLAKLGHSRVSLKDARAQRRATAATTGPPAEAPSAPRPRPAPTRRTSTGPSQHSRKGKRR